MSVWVLRSRSGLCCAQGLVRSSIGGTAGGAGNGAIVRQTAFTRSPDNHNTHGMNTTLAETRSAKYAHKASWNKSKGNSSHRSVNIVSIAYSAQSRSPRGPIQNDASARNPTKSNTSTVTVRLGTRTIRTGRWGMIESLKNRSTLSDTKGNHKSVNEPKQAAENERRRIRLQMNQSAVSQKAKKGSEKRGRGFGNKPCPSSAHASNGITFAPRRIAIAVSQGEVWIMSHRIVPRCLTQ